MSEDERRIYIYCFGVGARCAFIHMLRVTVRQPLLFDSVAVIAVSFYCVMMWTSHLKPIKRLRFRHVLRPACVFDLFVAYLCVCETHTPTACVRTSVWFDDHSVDRIATRTHSFRSFVSDLQDRTHAFSLVRASIITENAGFQFYIKCVKCMINL